MQTALYSNGINDEQDLGTEQIPQQLDLQQPFLIWHNRKEGRKGALTRQVLSS